MSDNLLKRTSFDTAEARHKFCKTRGIKSFYMPRSNPDGYDVNVRCLDPQPGKMVERLVESLWVAESEKYH